MKSESIVLNSTKWWSVFILLLFSCVPFQNKAQAQSVYGAPYNDNDFYTVCPDSPTPQAAVDCWWEKYQVRWAWAFPGCFYNSGFEDGTLNNRFAWYQLYGTCGGGGLVHGTLIGQLPPHPKENGKPDQCVGNPCDPSTGNKYLTETDYRSSGSPLDIVRHYNSSSPFDHGLGRGWSAGFLRNFLVSNNKIYIRQSDGREEVFTKSNSVWAGDSDTGLSLTQDANGFTLTEGSGESESYDLGGRIKTHTTPSGQTTTYDYHPDGHLQTITGPYGHTLSVTWNAEAHITSMSDDQGNIIKYGYDANGNLTEVIYPDTTPSDDSDNPKRIYYYEGTNFPNHLTGIEDENGVRYATYAYNGSGKAISTQHAETDNGAPQEKFTLTYDSATQTSATDAIGTKNIYTYEDNLGGRNLLSKINQVDGKGISQVFDPNNNLTQKTDEEGRVTQYTYNADNQRTSMTEAFGTHEARTTTYEYFSPDIDLVTKVISPSVSGGTNKKEIVTDYDPTTLVVNSITINGFKPDGTAISRTTTFTYNNVGQVETIDGPRTDKADITTMTYHECSTGGKCGQVATIANAMGHVTTYAQYDANGRLTEMTDPHGVATTYTYYARGWLKDVTQTLPSGNPRETKYTYTPMGQLKTVTTPDGIVLTYGYDAAHDLKTITDNLGNQIEYFYDLKGNRRQENTKDPNEDLVRTVSTTYDIRNRVKEINANGSITQLINDAVGNLTGEIDPEQNLNANSETASHDYDPLNRLQDTLDALGNTTDYDYDINDRLTQVTAPNGANTTYIYDDLGNLLSETSPDRGTTTYAHDAAGNVTTITDARGVTVHYGYDELNRVTSIDYPGLDEDITFSFDADGGVGQTCDNGKGRLCVQVDESGTTRYDYDVFGNVTRLRKEEAVGSNSVVLETKYSYDAGDNITSITYPDGRAVDYGRDAVRRVASIDTTVNSAPTTLLTRSTTDYRADGLVTGQSFGNSVTETRQYDLQGRLDLQTLSATEPPLYFIPGDVVIDSKVPVNAVDVLGTPGANEVGSNVVLTFENDAPAQFDVNTVTVVTWTIRDASGTVIGTEQQTVTVNLNAPLNPDLEAELLTPVDGSTLASSTETFTWSRAGASKYELLIGTSLGASDIAFRRSTRRLFFIDGTDVAGNPQEVPIRFGPLHNKTIAGLPTDGSTVYVRLRTFKDGTWSERDYIFTAHTQ